MLRELSEIVQMVLQVIIDAFYIYLRVDMDKKVTKPRHLQQCVGKHGWKDPGVTQEYNGFLGCGRYPERQVCYQVVTHINDTLNREL